MILLKSSTNRISFARRLGCEDDVSERVVLGTCLLPQKENEFVVVFFSIQYVRQIFGHFFFVHPFPVKTSFSGPFL